MWRVSDPLRVYDRWQKGHDKLAVTSGIFVATASLVSGIGISPVSMIILFGESSSPSDSEFTSMDFFDFDINISGDFNFLSIVNLMSTEIETIVNAPGFVLTYPKLEKIEKDLALFDHDTQQFMYHLLNGRYEEAQSYRNAILAEQEQLKLEMEMRRKERDEMIAMAAELKEIRISIPIEEEEVDAKAEMVVAEEVAEDENIIIETTLLTE
jgi:hypothetical protein